MRVCEECEASIDEFKVISTQITRHVESYVLSEMRHGHHRDEYRRQKTEASELEQSLETRIFEEYNQVVEKYTSAMRRFEDRLRTLATDSGDGRHLYNLDVYHYIGMQKGYNKIFPRVLRNAVLARGVELGTSQWSLESERVFSISPFQEYTDEQYQTHLLLNLSGPQAASLRRNPTKDLAETTEEIVAIMREISENHMQNWEVNYKTHHPEVLGHHRRIEFSGMREVKEFCPACGSLEWQGIHVEVRLTTYDSEDEGGTLHEYSGRITELNQQFLPGIIKAAKQHLDQLEKRIAAFEKFNQGIEKKVKRRIKKKADARKRAEIKALKAKLKELEDE